MMKSTQQVGRSHTLTVSAVGVIVTTASLISGAVSQKIDQRKSCIQDVPRGSIGSQYTLENRPDGALIGDFPRIERMML